jgi:Mn2+/Fe2+ NRAMP family transporter
VVCEAFGAERSVQSRFSEAPLFFVLFILLLATGAVTVAVLGPSSITAVAIGTQTVDGVLLPVLLVFILILANDRRLLGRYRNGPANNAVAVALTVVLSVLTTYLVVTTLTGL